MGRRRREECRRKTLTKKKSTLVIAKGKTSHLHKKVEALMAHYLGFLGMAKREKKRLEVEVKKLSDEKKRRRKKMAFLARALRKELQKLKKELKMKGSEKLRLQTSRNVLHQDTL